MLRRLLLVLITLVLLLVAAALLLPWQQYLQGKLIAMLADKGFVAPALTIDRIGTRGIVLKDVMVGDPPLKLASLTIAYAPRALAKGRIETVEIDGLTIRASQTEMGWQVEGMEHLLRSKPGNTAAAIPVSKGELDVLPLRSIGIRNASISLAAKGWQAELPLSGKLQHGADATIQLASKDARITIGADTITIGEITFELKLDDAKQQWRGNWVMKDITITSETVALPPLSAQGELVIAADTVDSTAMIASADKSHRAALKVHYALNKPEASVVTLDHASMPFSGGSVALNNVRVPLKSTKPIALKLEVSKLAIDGVMDALTGSKATATGAVSGEVPVTIGRDGSFRIGNSALAADGPGQIALSPDAIPGDNPQVALVREVLKNLQYTVLALGLDMSPNGELKAVLVVEGSNPDVENGRAIKLKVQLSGDLLNLITQNLKLMTDPKTFIEQNAHEKP